MLNIKSEARASKYLAVLYDQDGGYIETEGFSSKKDRNDWIKSNLEDLRSDDEYLTPENEEYVPKKYYALCYEVAEIKEL